MFDLARSFSFLRVAWWRKRTVPILLSMVITGGSVVLFLVLKPTPGSLQLWCCVATLALGILTGVLAIRLPDGAILSQLRLICGNGLIFMAMLGGAELIFRIIGFDFNQTADSRAEYPPCFRMPEKPLGEIYFHREGPFTWSGKPLQTLLKLKHGLDKVYVTEAEITLRYDHDGFRNASNLSDWEAVVVGDSFVESGPLPFEQIFTSQAAHHLGIPIRNLGVCETGLLSYVQFLDSFGKSRSTRHAVLTFYEGNDVRDTEHETEVLAQYRATGQRPTRAPPPQSSLAVAIYQIAKTHFSSSASGQHYQDSWLIAGGQEQPITLRPSPTPLDPETMTLNQKTYLHQAIAKWAVATKRLGLKPWLLYIPANNRTYHGLVRFSSRTDPEARNWHPGSLPEYVQTLCQKDGINFINTCAVLREAAEKGILVYNPILDTHLNREGSRLIGEVLAKHLAQPSPVAPGQPRS